jgi:protein TonB
MPGSLTLFPDARGPNFLPPRARLPRLAVMWELRRHNFWSSLRAVLSPPKAPKQFPGGPYFREAWVSSPLPRRALLASFLCHVALVIFPFPVWRDSGPRAPLTLPRIEVTWYEPLPDLPPLSPAGPPAKASPPGEPRKPLLRRGADAFHPRQTIVSAPLRPTHPRQTLIRPEAPAEPPKILPQLPNIVHWATAQPARPRIQISQQDLAKLRPRLPAPRPQAELPVPELPNLEKQVGELNIASNKMTVPKPRLPMTPVPVPRTSPRFAEPQAAPAPEITPVANGSMTGLGNLIALSPTPAPKPPALENLPVPFGYLAARFSISPEGMQPGVPGGSPGEVLAAAGGTGGSPVGNSGSGNGSGPAGVSITGGNPNAASVVSGVGVPGALRIAPGQPVHALPGQPAVHLSPAEPSRMPASPSFDRIRPGAPPKSILGPKQVYTLHVNMPNLASVTGSWVLSFTELNHDDRPSLASAGTLSGPVPVRKVDPRYPPVLMDAKIEGEVVLYAIIRQDGSVDSIQVVKGLEPQLDANAMQALARWRFRPAARNGTPVELEAIVHIPFRAVAPAY